MAGYAETYELLASRAIRQTQINLETLVRQMAARGMPIELIEQELLRDLRENGPIFGSFFRSLTGAAQSAVSTAFRQGSVAGDVFGQRELRLAIERGELGEAFDIAEVINSADPEALNAVEIAAADIDYTWIAASGNVCHLCLPLHGKTLLKSEWEAAGLVPGERHPGDWRSSCQCYWVPAGEAVLRDDLVAPLRRQKIESTEQTTVRSYKKTARAVTQGDIEKSLAAMNKAMESPEGRRILRELGKSPAAAAEAARVLESRRRMQGGA